tara:strand:+ start:78 stop:194 length:117 start_codon:yes stop_codon:yes gene_type:complete
MKKFITEPERNIEIVHETDVLVMGLKPSIFLVVGGRIK